MLYRFRQRNCFALSYSRLAKSLKIREPRRRRHEVSNHSDCAVTKISALRYLATGGNEQEQRAINGTGRNRLPMTFNPDVALQRQSGFV